MVDSRAGWALKHLKANEIVAPRRGLQTDEMSSAMLFATEAAYIVARNDRFGDPAFESSVLFELSLRLSQVPSVEKMSNSASQRYNDVCAIFAVDLLVEYERALAKHDNEALGGVRKFARALVKGLWSVATDKVPLDDFVCSASPVASCEEYEWQLSGGRIGTSPFAAINRSILQRL